jgi:transcription initiation factor IIE alpha subunit
MKYEFSTEGPVCPVCKYKFTPDESIYYDVFEYIEDKCPECGTKFKVEVDVETTWYTYINEINIQED